MDKRIERLVENVVKFPMNLQAVFRLTAKQTNSTPGAIRRLYYGNNGKPGLIDTSPMFMVQSANGVIINSKTSTVKKETKRTLTLKQDMLSIGGLSKDEKVAFFDMFFGK